MCRYGLSGPYKKHFACFGCRRSFKRLDESEWPRDRQPPEGQDAPAPCTRCGQPMADMGLDFKPPRHSDNEHWEAVVFLFRHGIAYHSCGCGGPGYHPSRWSEVPALLESHRRRSAGEALLEGFGTRRR